MKFTVTYKVNGVQFSATCDSVAEAYECVKAIVKRESAAFPRAEETLSGYIELLAQAPAAHSVTKTTISKSSRSKSRSERLLTAQHF